MRNADDDLGRYLLAEGGPEVVVQQRARVEVVAEDDAQHRRIALVPALAHARLQVGDRRLAQLLRRKSELGHVALPNHLTASGRSNA